MRHDLVISLQDLGVLASGLVSAGQILVLIVVIPTLRATSTMNSLHLHQAMLSTDYPDVYSSRRASWPSCWALSCSESNRTRPRTSC